jgi:putative hydrolase of the HAD superfamily
MLLKQYKYYLFDIDRTLWDFDSNACKAISKLICEYNLYKELGIEDHDEFYEKYDLVNKIWWDKYEIGEITKEYLRVVRFYEAFKLYNSCNRCSDKRLHELSKAFSEKYLDYMITETTLMPGAKRVLKTLKEEGSYIGVLSNGFKEVQYNKINNSGIGKYFSGIIISEEVGIHKPCPPIYKTAIKVLLENELKEKGIEGNITDADIKSAKKYTLMVGDDFEKDIEGAQIYGIDQYYYNPKRKLCNGGPTYESDNLTDIIDIAKGNI